MHNKSFFFSVEDIMKHESAAKKKTSLLEGPVPSAIPSPDLIPMLKTESDLMKFESVTGEAITLLCRTSYYRICLYKLLLHILNCFMIRDFYESRQQIKLLTYNRVHDERKRLNDVAKHQMSEVNEHRCTEVI